MRLPLARTFRVARPAAQSLQTRLASEPLVQPLPAHTPASPAPLPYGRRSPMRHRRRHQPTLARTACVPLPWAPFSRRCCMTTALRVLARAVEVCARVYYRVHACSSVCLTAAVYCCAPPLLYICLRARRVDACASLSLARLPCMTRACHVMYLAICI